MGLWFLAASNDPLSRPTIYRKTSGKRDLVGFCPKAWSGPKKARKLTPEVRFTKRFWQLVGVSFNGDPLLWAGSGCFCTVSGDAGFGSGATTGATEASSGLDTNNSGDGS